MSGDVKAGDDAAVALEQELATVLVRLTGVTALIRDVRIPALRDEQRLSSGRRHEVIEARVETLQWVLSLLETVPVDDTDHDAPGSGQ